MKKLIVNKLKATILILVIGSILIFSSTFIHEQGHVLAARSYGLNFSIKNINYLPQNNLKDWGNGGAGPNTVKDCEQFNSLPFNSRRFIFYSGFLAELIIFLTFGIINILVLVILKKKNCKNKELLFALYYLLIIIFIILSFTVYSNILSNNPLNDGHAQYLSCARNLT